MLSTFSMGRFGKFGCKSVSCRCFVAPAAETGKSTRGGANGVNFPTGTLGITVEVAESTCGGKGRVSLVKRFPAGALGITAEARESGRDSVLAVVGSTGGGSNKEPKVIAANMKRNTLPPRTFGSVLGRIPCLQQSRPKVRNMRARPK